LGLVVLLLMLIVLLVEELVEHYMELEDSILKYLVELLGILIILI
jgi:hypothetical protein